MARRSAGIRGMIGELEAFLSSFHTRPMGIMIMCDIVGLIFSHSLQCFCNMLHNSSIYYIVVLDYILRTCTRNWAVLRVAIEPAVPPNFT